MKEKNFPGKYTFFNKTFKKSIYTSRLSINKFIKKLTFAGKIHVF